MKLTAKNHAYSLYSKKYEENISCNKDPKFYFSPRIVLQLCHSKMKLSFTSCAMRKRKTFLHLHAVMINTTESASLVSPRGHTRIILLTLTDRQ